MGLWFLLWGGANSSHYIHTRFPGDKYKLHHQKLMQTVLGLVSCEQVACPSHGASTFLINTAGGHASHGFNRYQPIQHIYFQLQNWQMSAFYCFILA